MSTSQRIRSRTSQPDCLQDFKPLPQRRLPAGFPASSQRGLPAGFPAPSTAKNSSVISWQDKSKIAILKFDILHIQLQFGFPAFAFLKKNSNMEMMKTRSQSKARRCAVSPVHGFHHVPSVGTLHTLELIHFCNCQLSQSHAERISNG